eukprot:3001490-Alexandrium_andersonii.AAC.1
MCIRDSFVGGTTQGPFMRTHGCIHHLLIQARLKRGTLGHMRDGERTPSSETMSPPSRPLGRCAEPEQLQRGPKCNC